MTSVAVQPSPSRARRKILTLLAGLAVVAGIAFLIYLILKARSVDTSELVKAFAEASTEARAHVENVVTGVRSADYLTAVTELKAITESGALSTNQQGAISRVLSDIEGMPGARASTNAEAIIELIYELQPRLVE